MKYLILIILSVLFLIWYTHEDRETRFDINGVGFCAPNGIIYEPAEIWYVPDYLPDDEGVIFNVQHPIFREKVGDIGPLVRLSVSNLRAAPPTEGKFPTDHLFTRLLASREKSIDLGEGMFFFTSEVNRLGLIFGDNGERIYAICRRMKSLEDFRCERTVEYLGVAVTYEFIYQNVLDIKMMDDLSKKIVGQYQCKKN